MPCQPLNFIGLTLSDNRTGQDPKRHEKGALYRMVRGALIHC